MQRLKKVTGIRRHPAWTGNRGPAMKLLLIVTLLMTPIMPATAMEQGAERTAYPDVLSLRDRARLVNIWLEERLDTIVPMIMREQGVDLVR